MITTCTECGLPISDKALTCPHCGYPLKQGSSKKSRGKKRMRLPNGFGSITELHNPNLRKRFWVRVCVGKTDTGTPIRKPLKPESLFKTYNEAYAALLEYNHNPYDLDPGMKCRELYDKWSERYLRDKTESYCRNVASAWSYCHSVYDMRVVDIRVRHIRACMDEGWVTISSGKHKGEKRLPTASTKERIKSLWNLMLDYAVEYEIADRNYARLFDVSKDVLLERQKQSRSHMSFRPEEMEKLWAHAKNIPYVDLTLIQCYSGWRPQELANLRLDNVDFEHWNFYGGMKTPAGRDRRVPIHSAIRPFVKKYFEQAVEMGSEWLFNVVDGATHKDSSKLTYDKYKYRFNKIVEALELHSDHRPHDPRKQFITMAKEAGVNEYAIKMIVGHRIDDVTERVYTDRPANWLHEEIEKINQYCVTSN